MINEVSCACACFFKMIIGIIFGAAVLPTMRVKFVKHLKKVSANAGSSKLCLCLAA